MPPLQRAWCESCQTYGFIVEGVRLCHERGPWETEEDEPVRWCASPGCVEPAHAPNARWCTAHAAEAAREAIRARVARYRARCNGSPAAPGKFLDQMPLDASAAPPAGGRRTVAVILASTMATTTGTLSHDAR
jgi:hypothetical protein